MQAHKICKKAGARFVLAAVVQGDIKKKGVKKGSNRRTRVQSLLFGHAELTSMFGELDEDRPGQYKVTDDWHAKFLLAFCGENQECEVNIANAIVHNVLTFHHVVTDRHLQEEDLLKKLTADGPGNKKSKSGLDLADLRKKISQYLREWASSSKQCIVVRNSDET